MKPMRCANIPKELFKYTALPNETIMSTSQFRLLKEAAIAKNKLPEFLAWQNQRKIILKNP